MNRLVVLVCLAANLSVMTGRARANPSADPPAESKKITALPRALDENEQALIAANNAFAFGLLRQLNASCTDANIFTSPFSASIALAMTMNGAAGKTLDEMRHALGLADLSLDRIDQAYGSLIELLCRLDPRVELRIANSIAYRQSFSFEPAFLATIKHQFDAQVAGLDFAEPGSAAMINAWVRDKTNQKIDRIVDGIGPQDVMFLINAVAFKGDWTQKFDKSRTRPDHFVTIDGTRAPVQMMSREGPVRLAFTQGAITAELSYGGEAYAMTLLLPLEGKTVDDLVATLDGARWEELVRDLDDTRAMIVLPKFRVMWEAALNSQLEALGMHDAFVGGAADFSRMSRSAGHQLYLSLVKQKTYVDVDEEGTEAAAATSVGVTLAATPREIRFDRPFLFAIRERLSGTILFLGKMVRPPAA